MLQMNNISLITTFKIDNVARLKNLKATSHYYTKSLPNAEFIYVEERDEKDDYNLKEYLPDTKNLNFTHIVTINDKSEPITKTANYNRGAKVATNDIMVFLDVDIIIDTSLLISEIDDLINKNQFGTHIGYTGTSLYMTTQGEREFLSSYDINDLKLKWKNKFELYMGLQTPDFTCMNINSVGGCLAISRKTFETINGFNPNYKGWGYEDNEIITRAHYLKQPVTKSNIYDNVLYHLPHNIEGKNPSIHKYYESNQEESKKIDNLSYEQLKEYVKTW